MIGEPRLVDRDEQHYLGIRTQVPMRQFKKMIPQLLGEVFAWLGHHDVVPAGAPFMRFHVINMKSKMDIELGVPVASVVPGDDRVTAAVLPAGRYAALVYTGVANGMAGNKALLDWGAEKGLVWDTYVAEYGDGFSARFESYLTDPAVEPSPAKWDTEVAIRLADAQSGS
jgi:effector-binding domain-containing protein